jgi:CRP-like cAMP-binding protein
MFLADGRRVEKASAVKYTYRPCSQPPLVRAARGDQQLATVAQLPPLCAASPSSAWASVLSQSWLLDEPTARDALHIDEVFATYFHLADFPSGKQIYHQGDPGDRVYVIISGLVKVSCTLANGSEVVRGLMGAGDVVGELAVFDPGPRSQTAMCQTLVRAAWLTRESVRRLTRQHPDLAQRWLQALAAHIRSREAEIANMLAADVSTRVAHQIGLLAERFGESADGYVRVRHTLTRHEFAQLAGARREAVSQALAKFVERGLLITTPGGFDILDLSELRRRAHSAFPELGTSVIGRFDTAVAQR